MPKIVNLTPHAITIHVTGEPDRGPWTLSPSGAIARAVEHVDPAPPIEGIPTSRIRYGGVHGLPEPQWRTLPHPCQSAIDDGDTGTCLTCGGADCHYDAPRAPAVYYVVSSITAQAARATGRTVEDLLLSGTPVRDDAGRVIGCTSLARP